LQPKEHEVKTPIRLAILALAALPATALTQQQKVTPPVATYWMSIDTTSGLPMGGMGSGGGMPAMDIGRMMLGGGMEGGANRSMLLELGSQRSASGAPAASHEIPTGLKMGASLPLETPQQARRPEPREDGVPENFEKPRGRMLIYWGCGEQAGPGQPYVVDFARMTQGEVPQGLTSRRVNVQRGPSPSRSRTYGDWPNQRDSQRVPRDASLRGEHMVKGNYSPDIRFALADKYDFMEPVNLAMVKSGSGIKLSWNGVGNAHGYYASAMGSKEGTEDIVFWSSSNSREFGDQLMTWLAPGEVARLVTDKVVLPSATTECIVPAQFVAAAPAAFVRFIAYGEEANFVHPPRPQDPKVEWNQEWTAKIRLKSTAAAILGEGSMAGAPRGRGLGSDSAGAQPEGDTAQRGAPAGDLLKEGINVLKGLFGR
jgi:hypothetical protein